MSVKFKLPPSEAKKLQKKVKQEYGKFAAKLVNRVHRQITDRTPMSSGVTLASWSWAIGSPNPVHIDPKLPNAYSIEYQDNYNPTNNLPVGSQPYREQAQRYADISMTNVTLKLLKDPQGSVFMTNGARIQSLKQSGLDQGQGSRAFYMEVGAVPGYNLPLEIHQYFDPRGKSFFQSAKNNVKTIKKV